MGIRKWIRYLFKVQSIRVPDLRPSFLLYHNGGEVLISCIDNLGSDIKLIKEKVNNNENLMRMPNKLYRVLYHLDGTDVTNEIAEYIMESLIRSQQNICKIAIVGTTKSEKKNLNKWKSNFGCSLGINYFSSMDHAKDWLVSERFY
ncbi:hypothetical protein BVG16_26600 [Paenibacillus selenitireducens]|uniref:STAS/SEC14 domain-containing protein n=1 Tax=Paenibacillus selenitireducens TaxID=1324314 RepID=A0A1T2X269_9BACL|nr:hypothetical protein [Paenibacillus selenitireducens]OPA73673.1 hypothetical protein BVG16_26600 [Paenibacillus selenitireducens]